MPPPHLISKTHFHSFALKRLCHFRIADYCFSAFYMYFVRQLCLFLLSVCHFLVYCGDPPVVLGESVRVLDKYSGLGCIWTRFRAWLHLSTWLNLLCRCLNLLNSRHSRNRSTLHSGWRVFFFFIGQWDGRCAWPVKWHNGWYPRTWVTPAGEASSVDRGRSVGQMMAASTVPCVLQQFSAFTG